MPGHPAYAGGYFLDCRHQRIGQEHRPADAESELCACLAVGTDAGRVIVRSASDEAWAKPGEKALVFVVVALPAAFVFVLTVSIERKDRRSSSALIPSEQMDCLLEVTLADAAFAALGSLTVPAREPDRIS